MPGKAKELRERSRQQAWDIGVYSSKYMARYTQTQASLVLMRGEWDVKLG
jgi:hypothetical protein